MGGATSVLAACIMLAAELHQVPPAALIAIMDVEGGRVGQEVQNTNGSADLGPMQINTLWLPELAKHWNVDEATARRWVRDDACVNIQVAAWILSDRMQRTDDPLKAVGQYHSYTPEHRDRYSDKILESLTRMRLVDPTPPKPGHKPNTARPNNRISGYR